MSAVKKADIIGRIITLEAIVYNGNYADSHHSYTLHHTGCNYTAVPNAVWTRFLVHEGQDDSILLESVRYRNHYVDAHHSGEIHLTHSYNPPTTAIWARWRMVNVSDVDVIALESQRYRGSYLDCYHDNPCRVTAGEPTAIWAQWRIAVGPGQGIKDGYAVVASFENKLEEPTNYKYSHSLGASVNDITTTTLTEELSEELSINFSKGPLSIGSNTTVTFSHQWSSSESKTWSESHNIEADVQVPAGKKVVVNQLQGTYGPLQVHSNHITFSYD